MNKAISDSSCNSNFHVNLPALIILFLGLFLSTAGQAADPVGVLKFARGNVTIKSESGESRKAVKGGELMRNELVSTGAASIAVIRLKDDSRMTLRPRSEFRVTQLALNVDASDSGSDQSAVLNLLRGGLRLVTGLIGKVNPSGYRLSTPVATIGIRGTEFNTRLCGSDCAAEEKKLAGSDAATKVKEGLYVKVDDGRIFLRNFAPGEPLDLQQGESGYVADLNSLPVKLSLIPTFLGLDKIPSPSKLDFDNIEISDDELEANETTVEAGAVAAAASGEKGAAGINVAGTYEADISYTSTIALSDRKWFFGANPDIEFTLTQEGNKIGGKFSGDRDGKIIEGKIEGDEIKFDFYLEAKRGEIKEGAGNWIVDGNGTLKGEFKIRDQQLGLVRGFWTLTKTN